MARGNEARLDQLARQSRRPRAGCLELRAAVERARELGAVLASDECYAELGWDGAWAHESVPSVLDPRVTDGDRRGILSVYSLSKQSNLAGYRAAFLAGDRDLVARLRRRASTSGSCCPLPCRRR
jgi:aspartate/methionine/tyrosine aminotransferase